MTGWILMMGAISKTDPSLVPFMTSGCRQGCQRYGPSGTLFDLAIQLGLET